VYFWDDHKLNTLADADDVVGVTRKINGGENGLAHRKELLNKANGLLGMLELAG
jgi:putative chitinase